MLFCTLLMLYDASSAMLNRLTASWMLAGQGSPAASAMRQPCVWGPEGRVGSWQTWPWLLAMACTPAEQGMERVDKRRGTPWYQIWHLSFETFLLAHTLVSHQSRGTTEIQKHEGAHWALLRVPHAVRVMLECIASFVLYIQSTVASNVVCQRQSHGMWISRAFAHS